MNMKKCSITFLSKYINQLETNIQNYALPCLYQDDLPYLDTDSIEEHEAEPEEDQNEGQEQEEYIPFQKSRSIDQPRVCLWLFMDKRELEQFVRADSKSSMRCTLDKKVGDTPKGFGRIILIEFLIDATLYAINSNFDLEQISAILGIYYLSHKYFTDRLCVCPDDILNFFKTFLTRHCLNYPPSHLKIFSIQEGKGVLLQFCSLYLRHLPLVRLLTLPNFGFELDYEIPEEEKKSKKDKDKKNKKGKKDKKKKNK